MDLIYENKYHQLEQEHWWFCKRRELLLSLLSDEDHASAILDVGCASGCLLNDLKAQGFHNTMGIDISSSAVALCKQQGHSHVYEMDGGNTSFIDSEIDILIASDCLEHIKNDSTALEEWFRILKPGGKIIVFVPAYQFLWSYHDVANHHFRRYTRGALKNVIEESGFVIDRTGYWNFLLLAPIALVRFLQLSFKVGGDQSDNLKTPNAALNRLIGSILHLENLIVARIGFPAGVSTFAIAHKPRD